MGGSKPEWAEGNDQATLEEVFTSRSFGHPLPKAPRRAITPEPITASKLFFVRNRLVASGAVAAAVLSVNGPVSSHPSSTTPTVPNAAPPAGPTSNAPVGTVSQPGGTGPVSAGS